MLIQGTSYRKWSHAQQLLIRVGRRGGDMGLKQAMTLEETFGIAQPPNNEPRIFSHFQVTSLQIISIAQLRMAAYLVSSFLKR